MAKDKRQSFIVVRARGVEKEAYGPYRSFKRADGDARAADGVGGYAAYVLPLAKPDELP